MLTTTAVTRALPAASKAAPEATTDSASKVQPSFLPKAKPKMIIFDFGHTLAAEPDFDSIRGTEAVMRNAIANPRNLTPREVNDFSVKLFFGFCSEIRAMGAELNNLHFLRFMYDYLQIEFEVPLSEIEQIYWDSASPGVVMPDAPEMLAYLGKRGIRKAIISNLCYSENALRSRLDRLFPGHGMEFVIASSEYMFRKPSPWLFQLALRRADLGAEDVWYCGDSPQADIVGASSVEIFPVWYENDSLVNSLNEKLKAPPQDSPSLQGPSQSPQGGSLSPRGLPQSPQGGSSKPPPEPHLPPHLHIADWRELIRLLEAMP